MNNSNSSKNSDSMKIINKEELKSNLMRAFKIMSQLLEDKKTDKFLYNYNDELHYDRSFLSKDNFSYEKYKNHRKLSNEKNEFEKIASYPKTQKIMSQTIHNLDEKKESNPNTDKKLIRKELLNLKINEFYKDLDKITKENNITKDITEFGLKTQNDYYIINLAIYQQLFLKILLKNKIPITILVPNIENIKSLYLQKGSENFTKISKKDPKKSTKKFKGEMIEFKLSKEKNKLSKEKLVNTGGLDKEVVKKIKFSGLSLKKKENKTTQERNKILGYLDNVLGCSCTRTRCQKLYCVCFNSGKPCGKYCDCIECENDSIDKLNQNILMKNFENEAGCFCKNSKCIKKYCECYKFNKKCTRSCKCQNCENMEEE